jgi:hypothetical protein
MKRQTLPLWAALAVAVLVGRAGSAFADSSAAVQPVPARMASDIVAVSNVAAQDGHVSGTVVNRSPNPLENVRLLVRQVWYWNDERHPGNVSPGRTLTYTIPGQISPGGSVHFSFDTPRLPPANGGNFKTTAEIATFSELVPTTQMVGAPH